MTHGSLFSGIGGFDAGFEAAGMRSIWQVEKEPFCLAVLKTRFPGTEKFTDVRLCGRANLRTVDVVSAGFPCQDLSVAGKRAGLDGARSGLFWEVVRILGELRPTWFVLENVPGLFSSSEGQDFRLVLESLDELGYGLAWRVLNSQFFGVAQRRRRVFIVGRFGKPCPAEVLFEPESGEGNFAESGETGQDIAFALAARAGGTGSDSSGLGNGWNTTYPVVPSLTSNGDQHKGFRNADGLVAAPSIVQQAISSKWAKGSSGPAGDEHHNLTVCIQDARGQRDKRQNGIGIQQGGPMYTLDGTSQHACAYPEHKERSSQQFNSEGEVDGAVRGDANDRPPADTNGVRDFAGLPQGLDSARYRALGNAVTAKVAAWIGKRIIECEVGGISTP